ncbi:hypothetical protein [Limnoglobus roseus]|uniref:Peptidase C39-like domain-containing protein n=1 Tax=Limnoglobus roseus TaxID=2598579 RepID=A0A5C1A6P5_9BACT|nr:hypothetical protein [Limnoglobus roseus]QEL13656.1 hypothetical protein PX52LOC_00514 [Limnoglobus roseus]
MLTVLAADFVPSRNGFPFPNWFPPGTPVVELPTPFGVIPIGNANGGLCGGMVFTAIDLFRYGQLPPPDPDRPVVRYLGGRLVDSFNLPFGFLKYYDWQRRPTTSRYALGLNVQTGVSSLTIDNEWPRVQMLLDAGQLAALGLVKVYSLSPREMGKNHQVLAYGYDLDDDQTVTLKVYDPNYPGDDGVTLSLNLQDAEAGRGVTHSREGESVRGFFLTEYRLAEPPLFGPA